MDYYETMWAQTFVSEHINWNQLAEKNPKLADQILQLQYHYELQQILLQNPKLNNQTLLHLINSPSITISEKAGTHPNLTENNITHILQNHDQHSNWGIKALLQRTDLNKEQTQLGHKLEKQIPLYQNTYTKLRNTRLNPIKLHYLLAKNNHDQHLAIIANRHTNPEKLYKAINQHLLTNNNTEYNTLLAILQRDDCPEWIINNIFQQITPENGTEPSYIHHLIIHHQNTPQTILQTLAALPQTGTTKNIQSSAEHKLAGTNKQHPTEQNYQQPNITPLPAVKGTTKETNYTLAANLIKTFKQNLPAHPLLNQLENNYPTPTSPEESQTLIILALIAQTWSTTSWENSIKAQQTLHQLQLCTQKLQPTIAILRGPGGVPEHSMYDITQKHVNLTKQIIQTITENIIQNRQTLTQTTAQKLANQKLDKDQNRQTLSTPALQKPPAIRLKPVNKTTNITIKP